MLSKPRTAVNGSIGRGRLVRSGRANIWALKEVWGLQACQWEAVCRSKAAKPSIFATVRQHRRCLPVHRALLAPGRGPALATTRMALAIWSLDG